MLDEGEPGVFSWLNGSSWLYGQRKWPKPVEHIVSPPTGRTKFLRTELVVWLGFRVKLG